ncbi:hypothetical protein [Variovorax sp. Varisp36]|jgi:hypothetical protein|uniref:hypothetical protein n=1 Tax=Variovorax sp. Varisp36 TaxID=3243031 RepID=UPI0039A7307F
MKSTTRSIIFTMLAAGGLAAGSIASAASPRGAAASGTYQQELAVCGHNEQDRAACIREAGAARLEAARGGLTSAPDYRANALARCGLQQQPDDRAACEARVLGSSGNSTASVDGSVMGGGVIRESVTTIVMPAPAMAPEPTPMPAPMPEPMPMPRPMPAPLR